MSSAAIWNGSVSVPSPRNRKFADWLKLRDELLAGISEAELSALDNLRDPGPPSERDWP